jgi:hypothetical protein
MMVCSNCKHKNMAGAMFCAECGAQLVGTNELVTQNIGTDTHWLPNWHPIQWRCVGEFASFRYRSSFATFVAERIYNGPHQ